ncbi:hypothetical protein FB45DRAFT_898926 [Roridomyces roridus]|uniref:Uncharacterized protein n=1 Tax=Roridomyces roridus TaxID=1738132 RepID=A0AAD7CD16_9AGAR|nr:hypothetical protein FB45DRAFT_898926 [Roridomyces roridus]
MSVVVVDDRDPRIQYSPSTGWKQGGRFEQYLATTTVAAGSGSTASFSFQATSVAVYGTVDQGSSTMSFALDGGVPSVFDATSSILGIVHHQPLFLSGSLPDGQHSLVMTQESGVKFIFLDYILCNTTSSAGNILFFDDSDSRLEYSQGWNVAPGSEQYLQNTAHSCGSDECTVALNFEGNTLTMYGDFGANATGAPSTFNASITVDNEPPTPIQFFPRAAHPQPTSNFETYSTQLTPGSHRAVLTTHQADQFLLDYFVAEAPTAPAVPAPSQSSLQPTSTFTPNASHSHSPSAPNFEAPPSKIPVAAIVGIAVGGLVFLILLLVALVSWRRRARRLDGAMRHDLDPFTDHAVDETVYPYDPSTPPPAYRKLVPPEMIVDSNPIPSGSNPSRTQNQVDTIREKQPV